MPHVVLMTSRSSKAFLRVMTNTTILDKYTFRLADVTERESFTLSELVRLESSSSNKLLAPLLIGFGEWIWYAQKAAMLPTPNTRITGKNTLICLFMVCDFVLNE